MHRLLLILGTVLLSFGLLHAQKRPLTHDDFDTWKRIKHTQISPDGRYIVYLLYPGKGDATLKVTTHEGKLVESYSRAANPTITADSRFVIFQIKPALDSLNALRRAKTKEDKLPKDTLAILNLERGELTKIPRVKSYKLTKKYGDHITYSLEPERPPLVDTTATDSLKTSAPKAAKVNNTNGFHIVVRHLASGRQDTIPYVTEYTVAEEGGQLVYHASGADSVRAEGIYYYTMSDQTSQPLCRAKGTYKQLTIDRLGHQIAFVADLDTTKALIRNFELRYWQAAMDSAMRIADSTHTAIPPAWGVSENGPLRFAENGQKLYFSTTHWPVVQDTTLLPEEVVQVEIWSYKDKRLHTQQNAELEEDKKKGLTAIYDISEKTVVHPADLNTEEIRITKKGNSPNALGLSFGPYNKFISWEGYPRRQDIYHINLNTGHQKLIKKDLRGWADISAKGHFLYWFDSEDTTYYSYDIQSGKTFALTKSIQTSMANELNDQPNYPWSYGVAGWTTNDQQLLVYDRYDIFALDPTGATVPVRLTNGRADRTRYRYIDLNEDEPGIDMKQAIFHTFNETTRQEGFVQYKDPGNVKVLIRSDHRYNNLLKARESEAVIYTKENHVVFPDLWATDMKFKNPIQLSHANPEIDNYLWGTVEVYKWTSLDGIPLEGLLYKPENFQPTKQYPMIVYFYERNSHHLHRHWGAVPIRSIINPTFYASRGYVVFIPDIPYKVGYPGESAYNAVIPGVTDLIGKGFIDREKIGTQGHSWGGYQTAYLITKTNMFAAAESGAPVSNMISAYGGIRWETGLSRMFQYEHTQSRIGGTLWEYPLRFIENSPIFYVDKVETPLLIMHNDHDGHVPWYQGIELFVAMRRLGKPAWMLNYNGEPHWPTKWENIRDFNVRMQQYFDHYLKDAPMPKWMKEGIPAIMKGIDPGYETTTED